MAKPFLQLRGSVWFFRRTVPPEIRDIVGRREIVRLLKTGDLKAAKSLAAREAARVEESFDRARLVLEAKTLGELSGAEIQAAIDGERRNPFASNRFADLIRAMRRAKSSLGERLLEISASPEPSKASMTLGKLLKRFRLDQPAVSVKSTMRRNAQDRYILDSVGDKPINEICEGVSRFVDRQKVEPWYSEAVSRIFCCMS
jgi:hypothetical protein